MQANIRRDAMVPTFPGNDDPALQALVELIRQQPAAQFPKVAELAPVMVRPGETGIPLGSTEQPLEQEALQALEHGRQQMVVYVDCTGLPIMKR